MGCGYDGDGGGDFCEDGGDLVYESDWDAIIQKMSYFLKPIVRDQRGALKKEIRVRKAPLFLVIVWSRYLLFIQKIRKNEIQLHVQKFLKCY